MEGTPWEACFRRHLSQTVLAQTKARGEVMRLSKILFVAAFVVAATVSLTDALLLALYPPDWLIRLMSVVGLPGKLAAAFINANFDSGHNVASAGIEFVLSLPFNFLWWLLIFEAAAIAIKFRRRNVHAAAEHEIHQEGSALRRAPRR